MNVRENNESLWYKLWKKERWEYFLRVASNGRFRECLRNVTLWSREWQEVINRAALFCTDSSISDNTAVCGCQMVDAYSSEGLITAVYAWSLVSEFAHLRRRFKRPSFFKDLLVIYSTCLFQVKSELIKMPRYLVEETVSITVLLTVYLSVGYGSKPNVFGLFSIDVHLP